MTRLIETMLNACCGLQAAFAQYAQLAYGPTLEVHHEQH